LLIGNPFPQAPHNAEHKKSHEDLQTLHGFRSLRGFIELIRVVASQPVERLLDLAEAALFQLRAAILPKM
jgi:hypothetical protein